MRKPVSLAALPFLALLLGACAAGPGRPAHSSPSPTPAVRVLPRDAAARKATAPIAVASATVDDPLLLEVARMRGLDARRNVVRHVLGDVAFARKVAAATAEPARKSAVLLHHAFGFPMPRATGNSEHAHERYAGLYDFQRHELLVRADPHDPRKIEGVLVHELVHALQDQHFGMLASDDDDSAPDRALAIRALYEGDAILVRERFAATRSGEDEATFVARAVHAIEAHPSHEVARAVGAAPRVLGAPRFEREQALFPYLRGLRFVFHLYGSEGRPRGTSAIDAAFARPPTSTMEILHPEKYVARVAPLDLRHLLPDATETLGASTLGELRTSIVLSRCMRENVSAVGWAGDRFVVERDASAMTWVTAWDDEAAAVQFERRVSTAFDCVPGVRRPLAVRRHGRFVAVARGAVDARGRAESVIEAARRVGLGR